MNSKISRPARPHPMRAGLYKTKNPASIKLTGFVICGIAAETAQGAPLPEWNDAYLGLEALTSRWGCIEVRPSGNLSKT